MTTLITGLEDLREIYAQTLLSGDESPVELKQRLTKIREAVEPMIQQGDYRCDDGSGDSEDLQQIDLMEDSSGANN